MLIYSGTPTAAGAQINLSYLPQVILCDALVTKLNVNALGMGVVFDAVDAGLIRLIGEEDSIVDVNAATVKLYSYYVADGLFGGQNTQITVALATALNVYAFSTRKGSNLIQTTQQIVFANSGATFENFLNLYISTGNTTADVVNVLWADGTSQNMALYELVWLQRLTTNTNQTVSTTTANCVVDNTAGQILSLTLIPSGTNRTVGITKMINVK